MFHIILVEPEIPPNTGNIIRLAANTGCSLHLIEPMGFTLNDAKLRRAGLDYHEFAQVQLHADLDACLIAIKPPQAWAFSSKVSRPFQQAKFSKGDAFIFGPETRGLSLQQLDIIEENHRLRIPMMANNRSLNLSNTVAIAIYAAWQQLDFHGAKF